MNTEKTKSSKRRSLENGRGLLAKYKASQHTEPKQTEESTYEDSVFNETPEQSLDHQNIIMADDTSLKDTTQSSISMSEGEGDGDVESMAGRVAELKEIMQDRQSIIQALNAEFENIRCEPDSPNSSHSQNSSTQYKDVVDNYKSKLKDFDRAVTQRDLVIKDLHESLEKTIADRDILKMQLNALRAVHVPPHLLDGPVDTKQRISDLEQALESHVEIIKDMNTQLTEAGEYIRKLEEDNKKHDNEVEEFKNIIHGLNEQIRENVAENNKAKIGADEIRKRFDETVPKMQTLLEKFNNESKSKAILHEKEIQELERKHNTEIAQIKQTYEDQYKALFERYNTELPELESKHAKELQVFQSQASSYKKTIETLELELENQKKSNHTMANELNSVKRQLIQCQEDKELMKDQIQLHKIQIDELTAKYVAASSVLNSRESIERSLEEALLNVEALKQENDELKCKYDDISAKYAASQAMIENNQRNERFVNHKAAEIDKSLSRFSGISNTSAFDTTSYRTYNDAAIQYDLVNKKLAEKESLEKMLVDRINDLEETVKKVSKELEEANFQKKSYEKELKETKNNCEKMMSEIKMLKESNSLEPKLFQSNIYFSSDTDKISNDLLTRQDDKKLESSEKQIEMLKKIVQQKELQYVEIENKLKDALEKINEYKTKCEQLGSGLKNAWEQCAAFGDKLDQTLGINESKMSESLSLPNNLIDLVDDLLGLTEKCYSDSTLAISSDKYDNTRKSGRDTSLNQFGKMLDHFHTRVELMDRENQKLKHENAKLLLMKEQFDNARGDLEKRHAKEMEEVRTYFEEKCVQIEKQYSEEIFSQQSKKMSDDSEVDEMADDLFYGSSNDCVHLRKDSSDRSRGEINGNQYPENKGLEDINQNSFLTVNQLCQTEWNSAVENGELIELRAAYSHQLEEQVALAKRDIVNALQEQIQALIAVETDTEENWPPELLELRNKFTNNAKRDIANLKEVHAAEISQLKEEHARTLADTIESYKKKINKLITDSATRDEHIKHIDALMGDKDIVKQRDNLYRACVILKGLIQELVKYSVSCEEELNNTLISEVLRKQFDESQDLSNIEHNIESIDNDSSGLSNSQTSPRMKIKRIHFAPQANQILSILKKNCDIPFDSIESNNELTKELSMELEKCLYRFRNDSAQLFNITLSPGESILDTLSKQITSTTKINEELTSKVLEAENTIEQYEEESQVLKLKIMELQQKLITMDNSREIISEGYGEQDNTDREPVVQDFRQLDERVRMAITSEAVDNSSLLQLIEDLGRFHDKQTEEIKKDKEDLQQQIEAADKQLRATRKFLEEQASEREVERDEAVRQIQALKDQLKERDREKERDLRITSEQRSLSPQSPIVNPLLQVSNREADVEALELQLREMSSMLAESEDKRMKKEADLETAISKIWELRKIITSLENQIEQQNRREEVLTAQIENMNEVILSQSHQQQELVQELESRKIDGDGELNDHITHLQEELRRHKLSTEHFNVNSTALKQMKSELQDMLNLLDKKTKELETLHMCSSNLSISQPSEDVSIRDQIDASRCPSPEDPNAPPTLPLDQLLKLKEKLMKHTRAEEVAFKRIKDLDMQLSTLKIQNEELQAEQEILQQHNSEQLFQIETMRGRIEQQKQSAPFAERQATTKLELQLHEANAQLQSMEQTLANKELALNEVKSDLARVRQLLREKEEGINAVAQGENKTINELKNRIEILEQEKKVLEVKLGTHENKRHDLQLYDSILADKNDEIDHLKEQLSKREKQLEALSSLQMDDNNCDKGNEPKNSARTLSDILSIHSECEEVNEAIREAKPVRDISHNMTVPRFGNLASPSQDQFDGSSMPLNDIQRSLISVPPLELNSPMYSTMSPQQPQISLGSDSVHSSTDFKSPGRHSHTPSNRTTGSSSSRKSGEFSAGRHAKSDNKITPKKISSQLVQSTPKPSIEDLENQLKSIHKELQAKSATLNKREMELDVLQKRLDELRVEFKDSMDTLTRDKIFYQNQYELSQESESKIRNDLMELENDLKLKTEELEIYQTKIQTNEKFLYEVQTENATLKKDIKKLDDENRSYQVTIREKAQGLKLLELIISEKDITIETYKTHSEEIENENKQLYEYKTRYESCKRELIECQNKVERLANGISKRDELIQKLEETARRSSLSGSSMGEKEQLIIHQDERMKEKDKENRHNQELIKEKDKEIHHLQEYLKEKDKLIKQMTDDCKSLQRSLETIQSKMKESGNVVELRKKLTSERIFNDQLTKMVSKLKRELEFLRDDSIKNDTDIEEMVKRELNLSADLDKKILDAIDTDCENIDQSIVLDTSHLLTTQPVEKDLETIMQQYTDIRHRLRDANKINEQLNSTKNNLEIQQDLLKSQLADYENRILQIKADFETERKKNVSLSRELSNKKATVHKLENQLHEQITRSNYSQTELSDIVKHLRLKLTSSLESEHELRTELTTLRQRYKVLESKLKTLKESLKPEQAAVISTSPVLRDDATNNLLLTEKYESASREIVELKDSLKGAEMEKKRLQKQLEVEIDEREKMLSKIVLIEGTKDRLEIELVRTKEAAKSYKDECDWLQRKVKNMTETEAKKDAQQEKDQAELKCLRRELKDMEKVMNDLEADTEELRRQLAISQGEQNQLVHNARTLRRTEEDLRRKIMAGKIEEEKLKEIIADMQNDLKTKCNRELELSQQLLNGTSTEEKNNNTRLVEQIAVLTSEIARYSNEKGILYDKLIKTREDTEKYMLRVRELEAALTQSEDNEGEGKVIQELQQLYAKYLRVNSKKKALVFQKRYLLCVIGGYKIVDDFDHLSALSILAKLTNAERSRVTEQTLDVVTKCPKPRFRSAVLVVVALRRMKWMVQRWKSGRRKATNYTVGIPTQSVTTTRINVSPMTREKRRPDNDNPGTIDYEHYAQRFFTINKTLGLAMSDSEKKTPCK